MPIHKLRIKLNETLKPIFGKPLTNKHDGRVAIITKSSTDKIRSTKAVDKSKANGFSEAQHFEVAEHIKELYENANFLQSTIDKGGATNLQIHRYIIDIMLDSQPAKALITIKETLKGMYKGNKIYTIELEEVAKLN